MSDEYLTLTSDASLDVFADNKIGQFRVKLPKKIYLDRSRHQIGLKYISFPHKTYNIEDGTFSVIVHKLDLDDTIWPIQFNTKIPSGYYKNPNTLKIALNKAIKDIIAQNTESYRAVKRAGVTLRNLRFEYYSNSEKMTLEHNPDEENAGEYYIFVRLSYELLVKLGRFSSGDLDNSVLSGESRRNLILPTPVDDPDSQDQIEHTVDLSSGQNAVFVYSDVIENNRPIGNTLSPLLSIVPFEGVHGTQLHYEPTNIEYCEPRFDEIDEISIQLLFDTGERIKFTGGKVYVTLHIKDKYA